MLVVIGFSSLILELDVFFQAFNDVFLFFCDAYLLDGNPMRTVLLMSIIIIIDDVVDVLNENYRSNGS